MGINAEPATDYIGDFFGLNKMLGVEMSAKIKVSAVFCDKFRNFVSVSEFIVEVKPGVVGKKAVMTGNKRIISCFLAGGKYNYGCSNDGCTAIDIVDEDAKAIFSAGVDKGYSASESGTGIAFGGYTINIDALNEYNRVNEKDLTFGIVVANPNYIGDSFMTNGTVNSTKGFLQVDMSDAEYSNIQIMVNGFVGDSANLSLVFTLYAYTDADDVEFIQSEDTLSASAKVTKTDATLYTVTLNSVANKPYKDMLDALPEYGKENEVA